MHIHALNKKMQKNKIKKICEINLLLLLGVVYQPRGQNFGQPPPYVIAQFGGRRGIHPQTKMKNWPPQCTKKGISKFFACAGLYFIVVALKPVIKPLNFLKTIKFFKKGTTKIFRLRRAFLQKIGRSILRNLSAKRGVGKNILYPQLEKVLTLPLICPRGLCAANTTSNFFSLNLMENKERNPGPIFKKNHGTFTKNGLHTLTPLIILSCND